MMMDAIRVLPDFASGAEVEMLRRAGEACDEWSLTSLQLAEVGQSYRCGVVDDQHLAATSTGRDLLRRCRSAVSAALEEASGGDADDDGGGGSAVSIVSCTTMLLAAATHGAAAPAEGEDDDARDDDADGGGGVRRRRRRLVNAHHGHNGGVARRATLMIYLSTLDAASRGETVFPWKVVTL